MADMSYLIGAYAVFIGVTLVYVYSLVSRQQGLHREIDVLKSVQDSGEH
jgi:hypothetical protein